MPADSVKECQDRQAAKTARVSSANSYVLQSCQVLLHLTGWQDSWQATSKHVVMLTELPR